MKRVITLYTRRGVQFVYCPEDGGHLRVRGDPPAATLFFSLLPGARCVSASAGHNNIVQVAVTPKTTKCRLSHRTLQAATAKYRRGGPPAVIARHSSPRERWRCAPSLYTQGGGEGDVPRFALVAPPATFFVTFAIGLVYALSRRRGERTGNILQSG